MLPKLLQSRGQGMALILWNSHMHLTRCENIYNISLINLIKTQCIAANSVRSAKLKLKTDNTSSVQTESQNSQNELLECHIQVPNFQWLSCCPFELYQNQWPVPASTMQTIQWRQKAAGFLLTALHRHACGSARLHQLLSEAAGIFFWKNQTGKRDSSITS